MSIINAGAIYVPLGKNASKDEAAHVLQNSSANFVILDSEFEQSNDFSGVIIHSDKLLEYSSLGTESAEVTEEFNELDEVSPATIVYTSGSTGMPKGIMLSGKNLIKAATMVNEVQKIDETDIIGSVLPFNFDYGINYIFIALLTGAQLVIHNFLNAFSVLRNFEAREITVMPVMPAIIERFVSVPDNKFPNLKKLKLICSSGGALTEMHLKVLFKISPNAKIMPMYGFSEAVRSTYLEPQKLSLKPNSVGKPFPTIDIRVLNDDGVECKAEENGQIVHFGGCISLGYWENQRATAEKIRVINFNGQKRTAAFSGDYGYKDSEGDLYIVGRKDNLIKRSGFRVNIEQIERELFYVLKDEILCILRLDQNIEAKIILALEKSTLLKDPAMLRRKLRQALPSQFFPDGIVYIDEFPVLQNLGKIDKRKIVNLIVEEKIDVIKWAE